jgi:hypothetical protein
MSEGGSWDRPEAEGGFAPQPPPPPTQPPMTNGYAVASLVLGIIWIFWLGSILALVFGYVGKAQIDRSGGAQAGRGLAIAGIVLGWIGIATLLLVIITGGCEFHVNSGDEPGF